MLRPLLIKSITALIGVWFFCVNANATSQHTTTLKQLKQQIAAINQQLSEEHATLKKLQNSQENYQKQFDKQNVALAEQIRTLYKLGQIQSLKTVFNPDNFDNLNRHLYYSHYLNTARLNRITELKQVLDTFSNTISTINKHQQKLQLLLEKKQKYQSQLQQENFTS